jgi:hypothetical protein
MKHLRWSKRESEDGDVVVLAECLRGVGDCVGELAAGGRPAKKYEKRRNCLAHG